MKTRLIVVAICGAAFGLSLAQGPYPIPALERFPDRPYIPPPTPEEVALGEREAASNEVADAVFRAATTNVLTVIGQKDPTTWQAKLVTAKAMKAHAESLVRMRLDAKTNAALSAIVTRYVPVAKEPTK